MAGAGGMVPGMRMDILYRTRSTGCSLEPGCAAAKRSAPTPHHRWSGTNATARRWKASTGLPGLPFFLQMRRAQVRPSDSAFWQQVCLMAIGRNAPRARCIRPGQVFTRQPWVSFRATEPFSLVEPRIGRRYSKIPRMLVLTPSHAMSLAGCLPDFFIAKWALRREDHQYPNFHSGMLSG